MNTARKMKLLDFAPVAEIIKEGAMFHHAAFRRGYRPVSCGLGIEKYEGRFGRGYIVSFPSLRMDIGRRSSNRFHVIIYYLF